MHQRYSLIKPLAGQENFMAEKSYFDFGDITVGDIADGHFDRNFLDSFDFGFLFGEDGSDTINGGGTTDLIYAGGGSDGVSGNGGNDGLSGGLGSDVVAGGAGNDWILGGSLSAIASVLLGADAAGLGRGEIDTLLGGGSRDLFVLGLAGITYYDDGDAFSQGTGDYALIQDFEADGTDTIQLAGSASRYILAATGNGLPTGVGIYEIAEPFRPIEPIFSVGSSAPRISPPFAVGESGSSDLASRELIGIVAGVDLSTLSLSNSEQFSFV